MTLMIPLKKTQIKIFKMGGERYLAWTTLSDRKSLLETIRIRINRDDDER